MIRLIPSAVRIPDTSAIFVVDSSSLTRRLGLGVWWVGMDVEKI